MSGFKIRIQRSGGPIFRWQATVLQQPDPASDDPWPPPWWEWGPEFALTRKGVERKARREIARWQRRQDRDAAAETLDE
jgi:hypothetical protein